MSLDKANVFFADVRPDCLQGSVGELHHVAGVDAAGVRSSRNLQMYQAGMLSCLGASPSSQSVRDEMPAIHPELDEIALNTLLGELIENEAEEIKP